MQCAGEYIDLHEFQLHQQYWKVHTDEYVRHAQNYNLTNNQMMNLYFETIILQYIV